MKNEGRIPARQATREGRHRIGPETEIENRHREIVGVGARHRVLKSMADTDDDRAHPGECVLDIHREQQIVFDQEHCDAAQWMIIVY